MFEDEVGYRTPGTSALLLERWRASRGHRWQVRLHTSALSGPDDVFARVPAAAALRRATVTLVGWGAVGGRVALELAQHGVGELQLLDGDTVDPATASRQLQKVRDAGVPKVYALAMLVLEHARFSRLKVLDEHLGQVGTHSTLHDWLADSDLVIDCAASRPLTRYLAAQARDAGVPLLVASATTGAWGGTATLLTPETQGCWACLEHWRADGAVAVPPALPGDELTPAGCASPTFTGAGMDALGHVALHAVRLAVDALGQGDGLGGDVHTLAVRDGEGRPVPAVWRSERLLRHPACPLHSAPPAGQLALPLGP